MMDDSKRLMKKTQQPWKWTDWTTMIQDIAIRFGTSYPSRDMGSLPQFLFDYYFVVHPNSFLCCVFVCLFACCRRSVSCNQWCPCLRIIHSWLTLRFLAVIIYYVTSTISVVRSSSACSRGHLMVSYTGHPKWYDTKTFCFFKLFLTSVVLWHIKVSKCCNLSSTNLWYCRI